MNKIFNLSNKNQDFKNQSFYIESNQVNFNNNYQMNKNKTLHN